MGNDLVERLRAAMCPGSERCNVLTCYPDCECGIMEAAAARIEALEEALKPFAAQPAWVKMDDNYRPAAYCEAFTVGDLRRAARALETKPNPAKG